MAGADTDMTWARKRKLKMLGAAALSSTAMIGTTAVAASAMGALLLFTTALAVKGGALVRWLDALSVVTLAAMPSASAKLSLLPGKKTTTISQPEKAKPAETAPAVPGVAPTELGINLTAPTYYVGNRAFLNLVAGDGWRLVNTRGGWEDMPPDRLDANKRLIDLRSGEQAVRVLALPTRSHHGESVDIICRWQGTGTVRAHGERLRNVKISGKSLTFTAVPTGDANIRLQIANINPSDPVRGADCRETDANPDAVFDPAYLADLSRYSVLRFMKWSYGGVEGNMPVTWASRTKPQDDIVKGKDGIALEYMIQLANELKADPWFTIPWNADDEYVRKYAETVRSKLDPSLKAYVELSNEVWNYVYPVTQQALKEGKAAGFSSNDHQAMLYRYAEKTGQVMDVWSSVFAGQMHRTVRVVAVQNGAWNARVILNFKETGKKVDAVASAPYFNANLNATALATPAGVDAAFRALGNTVTERLAEAKGVKEEADKLGLRYITYEAGQHVLGQTPLEQMVAFQKDPRMAALYTSYLTKWREQIGDLMVLFADYGGSSQYGSWGQRDYVGQPLSEAPKENAVELFRRSYVTR